MTKRSPTNTDLAKKIDDMFSDLSTRMGKVEGKMSEFHDFMIVEKAMKKSVRDDNGKIDWNKAIERVFTFMIALAGCLYLLIEFVVKGSAK